MRYDDRDEQSRHVEDRRGQGGGVFQGGGGLPGVGFKLPLPLLIIGGLIMFMLGINPMEILGGGGGGGGPSMPQMPRIERTTQGPNIPGLPGQRVPGDKSTDEMGVFISRVLKDTEDVWERVFQSFGKQYQKPNLVLFTRATQTACGTGMSAMGPFYCPADRKVYVDLAFYEELRRRFKAPGDFAQAYVIAHEVGHHVQTLLGIADRVQQMKSRMNERQANALQVRMELQADCLAGVWAALNHQMKNRIEQGDIEEGLNAAAQIGDDMIQRQTQGTVVPEAFTHGSSAQRVKWFRQGMATGQIQQCDTFNAQDL
jgi:hypothetical protein